MPSDRTRQPLLLVVEGEEPVELIDDVLANSTQSLPPGTWSFQAKNGDDDGGGWEPPPLPAPPPEEASGEEKEGGGWQPEPLPLLLAADRPEELDLRPEAIEALNRGDTVLVKLSATSSIRLSHLGRLPETALKAPGRVVIRVKQDG